MRGIFVREADAVPSTGGPEANARSDHMVNCVAAVTSYVTDVATADPPARREVHLAKPGPDSRAEPRRRLLSGNLRPAPTLGR